MEELSPWNNTCNRFVAFLDIMGFRDRLLREGHEKAKELLESLYPTIAIFKYMAKEKSGENKNEVKKDTRSSSPFAIFPVMFSDSIILISRDDSYDSASEMLFCVEVILNRAITKGIPIKGAIAYGKLTADLNKSIYLGSPLIDAYDLQKELLLYSAVLHHSCEKRLYELNSLEAMAVKYSIPMKSGKITHYIVDWTSQPQFLINKNSLDSVTNLYNTVSGAPRKYVDNTLGFVRWVIEKKAELKQEK